MFFHTTRIMSLDDIQHSTILIVDDNPKNLGVLFDYLSKFDLTILIAQDGVSALRLLEEQIPDLILLDIMLPGMDGYEICRRIKMRINVRDVPVIFMTVLSETGDKIKSGHVFSNSNPSCFLTQD